MQVMGQRQRLAVDGGHDLITLVLQGLAQKADDGGSIIYDEYRRIAHTRLSSSRASSWMHA